MLLHRFKIRPSNSSYLTGQALSPAFAEAASRRQAPGDCVVIERSCVKTEQTARFESFRMRMFKVMDHHLCHRKLNFFQGIESLGLIVKRLRPKAFSPACLFRFLRNSAIFSCCDTGTRGEKGPN